MTTKQTAAEQHEDTTPDQQAAAHAATERESTATASANGVDAQEASEREPVTNQSGDPAPGQPSQPSETPSVPEPDQQAAEALSTAAASEREAATEPAGAGVSEPAVEQAADAVPATASDDAGQTESAATLENNQVTEPKAEPAPTATAPESSGAGDEALAAMAAQATEPPAPAAPAADEQATVSEVPASEPATGEASSAEAPPKPPAEPEVVQQLQWGFIASDGKIYQATGEQFRGRAIAKARSVLAPQIEELEKNFEPLVAEIDALTAEVAEAKNKIAVLGRVRRMKTTAGRAVALGDFETLFARIRLLEQEILAQVEERKQAKEALIAQAEEIKDSTDWKATGEKFRALFDQWKQVGAAGREADDSLWQRFIAARETFNTRRSAHFAERQEQWAANKEAKEALIAKATELNSSDQWRPTSEALRALFAEWKKVGSAGRQADEELWQRFRAAQQVFYDRRAEAFAVNKTQKEALCARAEELSNSTDWDATTEAMKGLMAEWRTIGTAGNREIDDKLWNRFRTAQNRFFDQRGHMAAARDQQVKETLQSKEALVAAAEALAFSPDAVGAGDEAAALQRQWDAMPPVRRDREEALGRRFRKAMADIKVNAAAEGARLAVTWEGKLREAMMRSREQIDSLQAAVARDEAEHAEVAAAVKKAKGEEREARQAELDALNEAMLEKRAEIDRLVASIAEIEESLRS